MVHTGYLIAIIAYMLMAFSQMVDKAFLTNVFRDSRAYACVVGLLNVFVIAMIPFGLVELPMEWGMVLLSIVFGGCFVLALLPFLSALQSDDASRVIPIVGSLVPMVILLIELVLYGTRFTAQEYGAFLLLVLGAAIMTLSHREGRRSYTAIIKAVLAAFLFAICFAGSKYVYAEMGFADGFFWLRIGGAIVGLALLLSPRISLELRRFLRRRPLLIGAYLANQGVSGSGFILQNYAIHLSSVSLVSALQGVQYLFILLLAILISLFYPSMFREQLSASIVIEKFAAVLLIASGLAWLFL